MKFKWILLSPVIVLILVIVFCEVNKAYWDHKVKKWCMTDGGVKVYENVFLSKSDYEKLIAPLYKKNYGDYIYHRVIFKDEVFNKDPLVWRSEQEIVRFIDKKSLGVQVNYSRRGGDFPTGFVHESHFGCGKVNGINMDIIGSIFIIREQL